MKHKRLIRLRDFRGGIVLVASVLVGALGRSFRALAPSVSVASVASISTPGHIIGQARLGGISGPSVASRAFMAAYAGVGGVNLAGLLHAAFLADATSRPYARPWRW